jgi:hypothetical protein
MIMTTTNELIAMAVVIAQRYEYARILTGGAGALLDVGMLDQPARLIGADGSLGNVPDRDLTFAGALEIVAEIIADWIEVTTFGKTTRGGLYFIMEQDGSPNEKTYSLLIVEPRVRV